MILKREIMVHMLTILQSSIGEKYTLIIHLTITIRASVMKPENNQNSIKSFILPPFFIPNSI